jgi:HlyB family type I secretion system ABC transporter
MTKIPSEILEEVFGYSVSEVERQLLQDKAEYMLPRVGLLDIKKGIYVVDKGKIRILDSKGIPVATLGSGQTFGEDTLFNNAHCYQVRASVDVSLYYLPADICQQLMGGKSNVKEHLSQKANSLNSLFTNPSEPEQVPNNTNTTTQTSRQTKKPIFPKPLKNKVSFWLGRALQHYPSFIQQSSSDCGSACLVMISSYWGKRPSVNRLRDISHTTQDGASFKGLMTAAEFLGFSTKPVKSSLEMLSKQTLPAIAHWDGNHFVVVWKITKKQVIISDPAIGQLSLTREEFSSKWNGYTILLEPTANFDKTEEYKTSFWQLFDLVKPHWIILFEVFIASIFIQIFGLVMPIFTQLILDQVIVQGSLDTLMAMGIGLVIFGLFKVAITGLRSYLLIHTAKRIDLSMIMGFIYHTLTLPLGYFENRYVGDIISRVEENKKIQRFLSGESLSIILDLCTVFIYIGLMFKYSWRMTLLALAVIPPFILLAVFSTPFLQKISRKIFSALAKENSYLIEILSGIRTVKAGALEQVVRWNWEDKLSDEVRKTFDGEVIGNNLQIISNTIQSLASTAMLWFGAYQVIQNQLTVGQLVAFNMLLGNIISPFQRLSVMWNQFQEVSISIERINDVLEAAPEEDFQLQSRRVLPPIQGHIEFVNVTFRYHPDDEKNVLENLSFEIQPEQMYALVGRSGSGKTTISKLLLGLYPTNDGKILIDGHDLNTIALGSLRKQIGVVDQDTFLFGDSIRENISLGDSSITLEKIEQVIKLVGLHTFIQSLPMGYETKIGEGGGLISGGQRQRLAIARALVGNPRLLIMDEATSHLDSESEKLIQDNLNKIRIGRTLLVIAHRFSTIRNADRILVLDQGMLRESGTHEELVAKAGLYYSLYKRQIGDQENL